MYDSNGPDTRIRGSARQIFERYAALAREAAISGDTVAAENLYQHAEHYFRVDNASRGSPQEPSRPTAPPAVPMGEPEPDETAAGSPQPGWGNDGPGFI